LPEASDMNSQAPQRGKRPQCAQSLERGKMPVTFFFPRAVSLSSVCVSCGLQRGQPRDRSDQ